MSEEEIETEGKYEHLSEREKERIKELEEMDKEDMSDSQITAKAKLSLKRKYSSPEWILLFELPQTSTTDSGHKRIDAVAINTYPSRNFKILAFEIKASRSDWLKEKNSSAKADYFVGQSDEFYVLAGRKGIVKEDELPEGWGLMEMKGGDKIWKEKKSELTEYQDQPLDKEFFVRAMKKSLDSDYSQDDLDEAKRRGYKEGKQEDGLNDYKIRKIRRKAEKFDKLNESDLNFRKVDESYLNDLKKAKKLIDIFDSDMVWGLEKHTERIKKKNKKIAEKTEEIEELSNELAKIKNPEEFGEAVKGEE